MTSIAKFLLTGLGGLGIVTATGYGVYYDANNKKLEKSKKDEESKSNVVEQQVDGENSQLESKTSVSNESGDFEGSYMGVIENKEFKNL